MRWVTVNFYHPKYGDVEAKVLPAFPGSWYSRNGDPGDPPEPAEVEILSPRGGS
jgi:hypothetical protein